MKINPRCDLLIGNRPENDSDNQYLECEDCHRYEICKKHGCVEMCSPEEIREATPNVLEPSYDLINRRIDRMNISEQVKELRIAEETCRKIGKPFMTKLISEAADTIEELSAKLAAANEELERWHTDKINEKIENPFAQRSTIICHNCDHKDEYIEELEAENIKRLESCIWILCEQGTLPDKEVLCCDNHGEMILGYVFVDETSETGFSAESKHEYMYNCVKWREKPIP